MRRREYCYVLDVEIHNCGEEQARYLVHGIDDVLWTDSIDAVVAYIKNDLERLEAKEK